MAPTLQLPQEAARAWGDPTKRAEIVAMHRAGRSLVEMVEALGLTTVMDADGLRDVITNLTPAEVAVIRDAFLAEAATTSGPGASFPVDCRVDDVRGAVKVRAAIPGPGATEPVARIEPA